LWVCCWVACSNLSLPVFEDAQAFNGDLSAWDVSKVSSMSQSKCFLWVLLGACVLTFLCQCLTLPRHLTATSRRGTCPKFRACLRVSVSCGCCCCRVLTFLCQCLKLPRHLTATSRRGTCPKFRAWNSVSVSCGCCWVRVF
jgi:surface protein